MDALGHILSCRSSRLGDVESCKTKPEPLAKAVAELAVAFQRPLSVTVRTSHVAPEGARSCIPLCGNGTASGRPLRRDSPNRLRKAVRHT